MTVLDRLAGALERRDEQPNVALAEDLAQKADKAAIDELIGVLRTSSDKRQKNDALKVLYEVGERRPELIAPYAEEFLSLLASHTNRQVWGAMQALEAIAEQRPETILESLPQIIAAADRGSVIANDSCTAILVKLAAMGHSETVPILLERLKKAAPNQFPTYAEETAAVLTEEAKPGFLAVLKQRITQITQRSKRERVERLMRKMGG
ncbi:hypothetical protein VE25_00195 [Devosia geojensis]|uniref:HEAT repeat domain-containing protein n=1 Tax=Devosia geojensis TaxID=443610 RepID=A0A0F5FYX9_9HYPH|nr:hypothetical protein [Devosia geojensis]KKB13780.1 hypothetical protein VE25_00195 [Devosia geojensis]